MGGGDGEDYSRRPALANASRSKGVSLLLTCPIGRTAKGLPGFRVRLIFIVRVKLRMRGICGGILNVWRWCDMPLAQRIGSGTHGGRLWPWRDTGNAIFSHEWFEGVTRRRASIRQFNDHELLYGSPFKSFTSIGCKCLAKQPPDSRLPSQMPECITSLCG